MAYLGNKSVLHSIPTKPFYVTIMCTVNEEDLDTLPEIIADIERLSEFCKKCGKEASVILRRKDVYCVGCFTLSVNHKFRASLGKNKTIRSDQRVLLAISGGLASSVLLNFVHNGVSDDSHKKLRIDPACMYINEQLHKSAEHQIKTCESVMEQCKQYGLPVYIAHLSCILDPHAVVAEINTVPAHNEELDQQLNSLLNSLSSETSRRDLIVKLRRTLLVKCAKQIQCNFILTGEISTSLASTMLANIALGRGAQIENDVGFCDSRDYIKILKPIKDLSLEEVTYFADIKKLPHLKGDTVVHGDCIQSTILKFVVDLQNNYPATISTICKTGEKMGDSHSAAPQIEDDCIICQSTLDTQEFKSSALQATEFSRVVSSTGPHHVPAPTETTTAAMSSGACAGCTCSKQDLSQGHLELYLCYGCRLIFRDIKGGDVPPYLKSLIRSRIAMVKLKNEINDFLL